MASSYVGRSTNTASEMRQRRSVEIAVRQDAQTETDALRDPQPMKIVEKLANVPG